MSEKVQAAVDEVGLAIVQLTSELRAEKQTPPAQRVDALKTLADAAAALRFGPQGGEYDYRSETDYKYTSDITYHDAQRRRAPVGFDGRHP